MIEQPRRIHPQIDYSIDFQCGCKVVFLDSATTIVNATAS